MEFTTIQLKAALDEAAEEHHAAERRLPEHQWSRWYAEFMDAREAGYSVDESNRSADAAVRARLKLEAQINEQS